ncbi:MAG: hypothetical protein ACR2PA_00760, partial [Hyphomicrobiaceae bacterium]
MRARQFLVLTVLFVVGTVTLATAQTNEWHGLTLETLTSRSAKERGLYLFEGALVKAARPGTPSAGQLAVGDVVSAVEIKSSIKRVATARDLVNALNDVPAGGT